MGVCVGLRGIDDSSHEAEPRLLAFPGKIWEPEVAMEALRIFAKPINGQLAIDLPPSLTSDRTYEVIVIPAISQEPVATPRRRQPSEQLAGTLYLLDDLIAPATPESDWELQRSRLG